MESAHTGSYRVCKATEYGVLPLKGLGDGTRYALVCRRRAAPQDDSKI